MINDTGVKMSLIAMELKRIWNKVNTPRSRFACPSTGNELTYAIDEGKEDLVNYLIKKNIAIDVERHNHSPLVRAIAKANIDLVKILIDKGAEVNYQSNRVEQNPNYSSPLGKAIFYHSYYENEGVQKSQIRLEIIKTLLDAGADVNDYTRENVPVLSSAMAGLHSRVTGLYNPVTPKERQDGKNGLAKEYRLIKLFIDKGADVNKNSKQLKLTPLTSAAKTGESIIVKLLLDEGAEINKVDSAGKTALHYAVEKDNVEVFQLLRSYNASTLIKDTNNKTPLDYIHGNIKRLIGTINNNIINFY